MPRHRFYTAVRKEIALCVTKGIVSAPVARDLVRLHDDPIVAARFSLDRSLLQSSRFTQTFCAFLQQQCRYHALSASLRITKIELFTEEPTAWFHHTTWTQNGLSLAINSDLASQPALTSPIQMDPAEAPTSTPLSDAQPTMQVATNINMKTTPTARESVRPLQRGDNLSLVEPVSLFSSFNSRIPLRELLQVMPIFRHVHGVFGSANRDQTIFYRLLQTFLRFCCHKQRDQQTTARVL